MHLQKMKFLLLMKSQVYSSYLYKITEQQTVSQFFTDRGFFFFQFCSKITN